MVLERSVSTCIPFIDSHDVINRSLKLCVYSSAILNIVVNNEAFYANVSFRLYTKVLSLLKTVLSLTIVNVYLFRSVYA